MDEQSDPDEVTGRFYDLRSVKGQKGERACDWRIYREEEELYVAYQISSDTIQNLEEPTSFIESEWSEDGYYSELVDFANDLIAVSYSEIEWFEDTVEYARLKMAGNTKQRKNCVKGLACGYSCIPRTRTCKKRLEGQFKTYAEWLLANPPAEPQEKNPKPETPYLTQLINAGKERFAQHQERLDKITKEYKDELDKLVSERLSEPFGMGTSAGRERELVLKNRIESTTVSVMREFRDELLSTGMDKTKAENLLKEMSFTEEDYDGIDIRITPSKDTRENMTEFFQLTGDSAANTIKNVIITKKRAWAHELFEELAISKSSKSTAFHEMGHHAEFNDSEIKIANRTFIRSRATGSPKKLSEIFNEELGITTSAYGDNEIAYPDKFFSSYVGKVYENGFTEVLSMGIQNFHDTFAMTNFKKEDPEHFFLTIGTIDKLQKKNSSR